MFCYDMANQILALFLTSDLGNGEHGADVVCLVHETTLYVSS